MSIDSRFYTHPSDRAALKALKAIPGFHQFVKAFMSVWNEKLFRIENMSNNLRVSEHQMKKCYDMLPPICEKLGIDIPELYIKLDIHPNSYTSGDTKPFIVITSGLIERFPDELIESVLAHECGHIACHHVLYRTMGQILLESANYAASKFAFGGLITEPLIIAFMYWMRCSEFSADRAAIICDGNADRVTNYCMRFAGYEPRCSEEADLNEFMNQAKEYAELMKDSKSNKVMEFLWINLVKKIDHPLNSVRAYEAAKWAQGEDALRIVDYLESGENEILDSIVLPVPDSSKKLVGQNYKNVKELFEDAGFSRIGVFEEQTTDKRKKSGTVLEVNINGKTSFGEDEWFSVDSVISIRYKP